MFKSEECSFSNVETVLLYVGPWQDKDAKLRQCIQAWKEVKRRKEDEARL